MFDFDVCKLIFTHLVLIDLKLEIMRNFEFTVLLIILMHFHVSKESQEESRYSCSQFEGYNGSLSYPLMECPPAKFMLKDNLVECFDSHTKLVINSTAYWCMSQRLLMKKELKI